MRGLPQYLVNIEYDNPKQFLAATEWNRVFDAWATTMKSGDYGMLTLDRSDANPKQAIVGVDTTAGQPKLTISGAALTVGQVIRIHGNVMVLPGAPPIESKLLNGKYTVQSVTTTTVNSVTTNVYTFLGQLFPVGATVLKMGSIRPSKHVVVAYNNVIQRTWRKRNTGSPFDGHPSGRRK